MDFQYNNTNEFINNANIINDNIKTKKIINIVTDLLNAGFIVYGNFCKNVLNNCCNNIIDICCTIHQYIFFWKYITL